MTYTRKSFAHFLISMAVLSFLAAGLFHATLKVSVNYPEYTTSGFTKPHLIYVWKHNDKIAVQF